MGAPAWLTINPVAHRGLHDASQGVIENTVAAAEAAVAGGYAIEIDVRLAADGVVVFHDEMLDRLTNATGPVAERKLGELADVKLIGTDDKIPPLSEFLKILDGRAALFVEIKSDPGTTSADITKLAALVVADLKSYRGDVAVMSFSPHLMAEIKNLAPYLTRGLVSGAFKSGNQDHPLRPWQRFYLRHLLSAASVMPHFIAYDVNALPAFVPAFLRKIGRPLLSWTVRTPHQVETVKNHADQMIFEGFRP